MDSSLTRINLACGREYMDGWLNVDNKSMFPDTKVDVDADITKMDLPLESVDEIRLSHFIMYTRPEELKPLLLKWYGWLKPGGKLDIECIDVKKVCEVVANSNDSFTIEKWGLVNLFGNEQTCPHRWGWNPEALFLALYDAGFTECQYGRGVKKPERDFRVVAIKHGKRP